MIILKSKKINTNIEEILKSYIDTINFGPLKCPHCQSVELIKWGVYKRNAFYIANNTIKGQQLIIQRYKCKDCGKTHGILPEGLIPYKQFSTDIIVEILSNPYSNNIGDITNYISFETVKRWQKQFKNFFSYLITMYKTTDKVVIFNHIKNDILDFYETFYKTTNVIFMQIKFLYLNLCPL